jgi:hypothetical protein
MRKPFLKTTADMAYFTEKRNIIDTFTKNKVYHLHNSYHLGDNLYNFIVFYNIKNYIEEHNIKIFYYALEEHLSQVSEFVCSPNICLLDLKLKPSTSIELWGDEPLFKFHKDDENNPYSMNVFLITFYNNVLNVLNIDFTINRFFYIDEELVNRYEKIPDKYKDFDILIINSQPRSFQYDYVKSEWDDYIVYLSRHFNVLTTTKVYDLLCTYDDKLTVKDIGSISRKAKVIIAINSGVLPTLLNYETLTNVKSFYTFDKWKYFTYPNFKNSKKITDITVDELKKYM